MLYDIWWTKNYFGSLDNLCREQKVVTWFSGGQEFQFFSCPLTPNLSSTKNSLKIKHSTTKIVQSNPLFFSKSNTLIKLLYQIKLL
jgi:hypothetical protein